MKIVDALVEADKKKVPDLRNSFRIGNIVSYTAAAGEYDSDYAPSCAIGGANLATNFSRGVILADTGEVNYVGGQINDVTHYEDAESYRIQSCAICGNSSIFTFLVGSSRLAKYIIHLYDEHRLSRTDISNILKSKSHS